jgi:hypothetical protein
MLACYGNPYVDRGKENAFFAVVGGISHLLQYVTSFQKGKRISEYTNAKWAAFHGYLFILQKLHNEKRGIEWELALFYAVGNGKHDIVRWICQNRKEKHGRALVQAAFCGYLDDVKLLYKEDEELFYQREALHSAIEQDHTDIILWLSKKNFDQLPVYLWIISSVWIEFVRLLYTKEKSGAAIYHARRVGNKPILDFLLNKTMCQKSF